MQHIDSYFIKQVKKEKMQQIEKEMREIVLSHAIGETFICPKCNYSSKKNSKGSARRFQDSFKCFSCGIWRRI